jgi:hypothetical protein
MTYFSSKSQAQRAYPNAKICKVLKGAYTGDYVAFNDWLTYEDWQRTGYVR